MGKKDWKNTLSGVFDVIGEVLAVVYVVVFALLLIDAQWPFLSNVDWLYAVFKGIWTYGAFAMPRSWGWRQWSSATSCCF